MKILMNMRPYRLHYTAHFHRSFYQYKYYLWGFAAERNSLCFVYDSTAAMNVALLLNTINIIRCCHDFEFFFIICCLLFIIFLILNFLAL